MFKFLKVLAIIAIAADGQMLHAADSSQESILSLTHAWSQFTKSHPLTETYRNTPSVDTSLLESGGSFLDQVTVEVSSSLVDAESFDAPARVSTWSLSGEGFKANGCSGSGYGFECVSSLSLGSAISFADDSFFSLVLDVTMDKAALSTGFDESTVKVRLVNDFGYKVGDLAAENAMLTSAVPEPEVYTMMFAALGLMGYVARRRKSEDAVFFAKAGRTPGTERPPSDFWVRDQAASRAY